MKTYIIRNTVILIITLLLVSFVSNKNNSEFNKKPRNIIFLIGDGMGIAHLYAGMTRNHGKLFIEEITHVGLQKTYSADSYITDSAASGTAMASGTKTKNGVIGQDTTGAAVKSILEYAEDNGLATGLISTSAITHATPASFIAHVENRGLYEDIAADFLKTEIDVFIGGGADHFMHRMDSVDLVEVLKGKGYSVLFDMEQITRMENGKLAGFTANVHNPPYLQGRNDMLPEATRTALNILSKNRDGFFLMVEGSQIDWGGHGNDTEYIISEMLDFDRAIKEALDFAMNDKNTLVVITADHETGGMSLIGGDFISGEVNANYGSTDHTGVMVPVYAYGPGAEEFTGIYENTDLFEKFMKVYGFKKDKE